jgi:hypothetical protein
LAAGTAALAGLGALVTGAAAVTGLAPAAGVALGAAAVVAVAAVVVAAVVAEDRAGGIGVDSDRARALTAAWRDATRAQRDLVRVRRDLHDGALGAAVDAEVIRLDAHLAAVRSGLVAWWRSACAVDRWARTDTGPAVAALAEPAWHAQRAAVDAAADALRDHLVALAASARRLETELRTRVALDRVLAAVPPSATGELPPGTGGEGGEGADALADALAELAELDRATLRTLAGPTGDH